MSAHEAAFVKVNARIDKEIAPLVEALNEFDCLETVESCQGSEDTPAWVCFRYGDYDSDPWHALADFVLDHLGPALARDVGDSANVRIQMTASGLIFGELWIRPGQTAAVENAVRRLLHTYRAPRP